MGTEVIIEQLTYSNTPCNITRREESIAVQLKRREAESKVVNVLAVEAFVSVTEFGCMSNHSAKYSC